MTNFNKDLSVCDRDTMHSVFVGDNIPICEKLIEDHRNTFDICYIDPPYGCVKNSKKIEVNYKNNFERSEYLKTLRKTLNLVYELLKDDGLFWLSCDNRNIHHFRILLDDIFEEHNFLACFPRKTRYSFNMNKNLLNKNHDYLLVYSKDITKLKLLGELKDNSAYKNPDNDPNGDWRVNNLTVIETRKNRRFPIVNPYTGKIDIPTHNRMWVFTQKTFHEHIKTGRIIFKKEHKPEEYSFIFKLYLKDRRSNTKNVDSLHFLKNDYLNSNGTKELNKLNYPYNFYFVKPMSLIEEIIRISNKATNCKILDCFGGSGTTSHAVINMNEKDGGSRESFLISLNENNYMYKLTIPRIRDACLKTSRQGVNIYE